MANIEFTRNLGITKIPTGEQAGVWGQTTNTNFDFFDDAIDGSTTIPLGQGTSSYTVSTIDGGVSEGRKKVLHFTGTLSAACTIKIEPADAVKHYIVINDTNGNQELVFSQGGGSAFHLAAGFATIIYCDGLGTNAGVYGAIDNLQVNNLKIKGTVAGFNVTGNISTTGNIAVTGTGTLTVAGLSTLTTLTVTGASTLAGTTVAGAMTSSGGLSVTGAFTTSGSMQFDLPSSASGDIYYRTSLGPLARLGIGSAGQYLRVSAGYPAWATVDTSLTIGTTPITGGTTGRVLFTNNGVLSDSAWLVFVPANGNLGIGGSFGCANIACSNISCAALTASGDITANSGVINFANAFSTQIQATGGNWTFKKTGTGAIWFENNGMEMLRMHHTKHLMFACPPAPGDLNYTVIDSMMNNSQACLMWDEGRSTLVIRMKGSQGGMGQCRIQMIAP